MKYAFFSLLILLAAQVAEAQSVQTLEVKGQGEITTQPDVGVLHVQLHVQEMDFGQTVKSLSKVYDQMIKQLDKLGFEEKEVKTSYYSVNQHTVYSQGRSYDSGFVGQQQLMVEFPNQKERIAEITESFERGKGNARFSYSFKLSKEKRESVRNDAITGAMEDARQKASLIARAAGLQLGQVRTIRYGTMPYEGPIPMYKEMSVDAMSTRQASAQSSGFEVQELTLQDEVVVIYELNR